MADVLGEIDCDFCDYFGHGRVLGYYVQVGAVLSRVWVVMFYAVSML